MAQNAGSRERGKAYRKMKGIKEELMRWHGNLLQNRTPSNGFDGIRSFPFYSRSKSLAEQGFGV